MMLVLPHLRSDQNAIWPPLNLGSFICFHKVTRRIKHLYLLNFGKNHGTKSHYL